MKYFFTEVDDAPECRVIGIGKVGKEAIERISQNIHFIQAEKMTFHYINEDDINALNKIPPLTALDYFVVFLTDKIEGVQNFKPHLANTDCFVITSQLFKYVKHSADILSYCDGVICQQEITDYPLIQSLDCMSSAFFYWALRAMTDFLRMPGMYQGDFLDMQCMLKRCSPIFLSVGISKSTSKNSLEVACQNAVSTLNKDTPEKEMVGILGTINSPANYGLLDHEKFFKTMESYCTGKAYSQCFTAITNFDTNKLIVLMLVSYTIEQSNLN